MDQQKKLLSISLGVIVILAIAYKANPGLFTPKTPGSFEYVRKGEDLLNKSKYEEAIASFEKAHKASPDNKEIKQSLICAYFKYADSLAEKSNYGPAIGYLAKACNVVRDTYTIQQLALMNSKMALEDLRDGKTAEAVALLSEARSLAAESGIASKNLGISLFNDAVGEYKEGREKNAIILLKEAMLVYEDSRILEFTGDIYYKLTELDRAAFYWNAANALNPESKTLPEKIERAEKEKELARAEERLDSPHFDIRYEKTLPVKADSVRLILEKAYIDVGKDLGYFPGSKTTVFIYSEDNFRIIFKLPEVIRAFYDGNIRMPLPEKALDPDELDQYVYHEYTHAVISAKTNGNCPIWFNEGIATWENFKGRDGELAGPLSNFADAKVSINALDGAFKGEDKSVDLRSAYLLSYTVVKYVIDTWGMGGLRDILKRMADGQHIANAIDDEFLLPEKEFENRWKGYLKRKWGKNG